MRDSSNNKLLNFNFEDRVLDFYFRTPVKNNTVMKYNHRANRKMNGGK